LINIDGLEDEAFVTMVRERADAALKGVVEATDSIEADVLKRLMSA